MRLLSSQDEREARLATGGGLPAFIVAS